MPWLAEAMMATRSLAKADRIGLMADLSVRFAVIAWGQGVVTSSIGARPAVLNMDLVPPRPDRAGTRTSRVCLQQRAEDLGMPRALVTRDAHALRRTIYPAPNDPVRYRLTRARCDRGITGRAMTHRLHQGASEHEQASWTAARLKAGGAVSDVSLWLAGIDQPMRILAQATAMLRAEGVLVGKAMRSVHDAGGDRHDVLTWSVGP